jgi:hypothetical protein
VLCHRTQYDCYSRPPRHRIGSSSGSGMVDDVELLASDVKTLSQKNALQGARRMSRSCDWGRRIGASAAANFRKTRARDRARQDKTTLNVQRPLMQSRSMQIETMGALERTQERMKNSTALNISIRGRRIWFGKECGVHSHFPPAGGGCPVPAPVASHRDLRACSLDDAFVVNIRRPPARRRRPPHPRRPRRCRGCARCRL